MLFDHRGVAVTTQTRCARDALDRGVASFLAHRRDMADHLSIALTADPGLVAAHCLLGFSDLLLGRSELLSRARSALRAARSSLGRRGGTARERGLTEALAT